MSLQIAPAKIKAEKVHGGVESPLPGVCECRSSWESLKARVPSRTLLNPLTISGSYGLF